MTQTVNQHFSKISSLCMQKPQPTCATKWATTLKFGKILGTTSVVRSIQNPWNIVRCKNFHVVEKGGKLTYINYSWHEFQAQGPVYNRYMAVLVWWSHSTLKQGSKVTSDTCKRFTGHDFLQIVFIFWSHRTTYYGDIRPFSKSQTLNFDTGKRLTGHDLV